MTNPLRPRAPLYTEKVKPRLAEIEQWVIDNETESLIAKRLGVSYSIFRQYKDDYPELRATLLAAKMKLVERVEQALFKSALPRVSRRKKVTTTETPEGMVVSTQVEERDEEGNYLAQQLILTNKMPDNYKIMRSQEVRGEVNVNVRLPEVPKYLLIEKEELILIESDPIDAEFSQVKDPENFG